MSDSPPAEPDPDQPPTEAGAEATPEEEPAYVSEMPIGHLAGGIGRQAARTIAEAPLSQLIDEARINIPTRGNRKLEKVIQRVNADRELKAWWHVANVNAVVRLQMNDHSWVHVQIITNIGLKLLRLLVRRNIKPGAVTDFGMTNQDAEVVVVLGCLLHCIGMSIHRQNHEEFSLFLAARKAPELLEGLYAEDEQAVIVSEVLQAIISHRSEGKPLSVESGVVRVADALDMSNGRSRIPFDQGRVGIHSLSAAAIEAVHVKQGEDRPILIEIEMNNSSGVFQVDELLKSKLSGSGLEHYIEVVARVSEEEKRLVSVFRL